MDEISSTHPRNPKLLAGIADGHDVVYGVPLRERHARWRGFARRSPRRRCRRRWGRETATMINSFSRVSHAAAQCFATYRRAVLSRLNALLSWATNDFASANYRHDPPARGAVHVQPRLPGPHAVTADHGVQHPSAARRQHRPLRLFPVSGLGVLASS